MEAVYNNNSYNSNANSIEINDNVIGKITINGASDKDFVNRIKYSNFRLYNLEDSDYKMKLLYYKSEFENNKEVKFEDFKKTINGLEEKTKNNVMSKALTTIKANEIYYGKKEITSDFVDISNKDLKELENIHNNIFKNVNKNSKVTPAEKEAYENEFNQISDGNKFSDSYKYKKYGDLSMDSFKVGLKMYQDLAKVNLEHKNSLVWRLQSVFNGPQKQENQLIKKMESNLLKVDFVSRDELNAIKGVNTVFDGLTIYEQLINKSRSANLFDDYYRFKMEEEKSLDANNKTLNVSKDDVVKEKMDLFDEISKEDVLEDEVELDNNKNIEINKDLNKGGI